MKLTTRSATEAAHAKLVAMLHENDPEGAIEYVKALSYTEAFESEWKGLLAHAYTDGGAASGRRDQVALGAELWRQLDPQGSIYIAYNLANAELALWEIAVRNDGLISAWEHERQHLNEARALYERVGRDETAPQALRVQVLTNAGNSYDIVGRNVEALDMYDEVLSIDQDFAMALGNRGIALKHFAPFTGEHAGKVIAQAAADLTLALQNTQGMECDAAPQAAKHFRAELDTLPDTSAPPSEAVAPFSEGYLRWCHRHELFLHVWPRVLSEDTQHLDPLFIKSLETPMGGEGLARLQVLIDAFNALKQDYVAARYSIWLAEDPNSPVGLHSGDLSARTLFIDTIQCARWGLRTGMMVQAFAAATNILDKIAGFVHQYLDTGRLKDVSFGRIDRPDEKKPIDSPLRAVIDRPEHNFGLLALLDLSHDLQRGTDLKARVSRRHKATHRFVVAHNIMVPEAHEWVDRVEWLDLAHESICQLRTARIALIYLARLIDQHERVRCAGLSEHTVSVPMGPVDTRVSELL